MLATEIAIGPRLNVVDVSEFPNANITTGGKAGVITVRTTVPLEFRTNTKGSPISTVVRPASGLVKGISVRYSNGWNIVTVGRNQRSQDFPWKRKDKGADEASVSLVIPTGVEVRRS